MGIVVEFFNSRCRRRHHGFINENEKCKAKVVGKEDFNAGIVDENGVVLKI